MPDAAPISAPQHISYRAEMGRKALHLLALLLPFGAWHIGPPLAQMLLGLLAVIAFCCDVLRARSVAFNRFIDRVFGWMMRADEKPPVPGPIALNGATWVALSIFVLTLFFPLDIAVPAFAAFMVGDAAAALVGRRFGRLRWPGTSRTIEGSAAFLVVATGMLLLLRVAPVPAVVCASLCAIAEGLPGPINDNLIVPLTGALVLLAFAWL